MYIYIYIYMYVYICIYIYIYYQCIHSSAMQARGGEERCGSAADLRTNTKILDFGGFD